ncbi:MAG: formate dehydrogenase subunit alpha [Acidobacteria bacterium]|nr:formate dehydrogenase subunit alpha [Acidobacteriota bacterium]
MVRAKFNGTEMSFNAGISILAAAREAGLEIPTICNDERLKAVGACRLCLVGIRGEKQLAMSCTRTLEDGMEIETHSAEIERARRMNLRMLAKNYPYDAVSRFPDKDFHRLTLKYGLKREDFADFDHQAQIDRSHVYMDVDMTRCINCYKCRRICDEVQGQFVWRAAGRGAATRIVPEMFDAFAKSGCVSCGACADVCPTGAIEDKKYVQYGEPAAWTKTVCPYCGTGCEMNVGTSHGRIVQIRPVRESPVNHGHLCVKGRYAFDFVHSDDRVTEPMIRENGDWRKVDWATAFRYTADRLGAIVSRNGADSAAVLGSARATNEENYLAQKFARVCLETNNVDNCARVCHTPSAAALKLMLSTGAATNSFRDIERAETIMICGANPTENHPILGARIKQAVLRNKTRLIVIDPRRIELARYADVHLQLKPGTNIALLNSIACAIFEEELVDHEFIAARVEDFDKYREFIAEFQPEKMADICGVKAGAIREAARLYASSKPSMCVHGLGTTEHTQGTEGVMCLVNLALITGNLGKPGTGVNPLRGQNNVQGAAQMGCDPGILTGSIAVEEGRALFESVWGRELPRTKGLSQLQMMDAARDVRLKALWTIGYDVFLTNANAAATERALGNLELVIVQDMFLNETAKKFGHVFLPAASSFEKDGTFMNGERRISRVRKAIEPLGDSKSDWEIICGVAAAMGHGQYFSFRSAEEIWNEIRLVWPGSYGITYERIEDRGLQWNCPDLDHPGTEILHGEKFGRETKASLKRIRYNPTFEKTSPDFPLLLNTGRTLYQFNAGTMTLRTKNRELRPFDLLSISPADAARLNIADSEVVRVKSLYGEVEMPVEITDKVTAGELFATFHNPEIFLNRITSPNRDRFVQTPEYKVTAVRVEKIGV